MALFEKIDFLAKLNKEKPDGVLSIYLDTDRSKPEQQNVQWKVRLKNGLKKLEEYLEAQQALEEKNIFKKLSKKVEKEIHQLQREYQKGLILFASPDLRLWELEFVQVQVENEFHWEPKPAIEQLEGIYKMHPPSGLVLIQQNQVRVLDTALGQVHEELEYDLEMATEDGKKLLPTLQQEAQKRNWEKVYLIGNLRLIDLLKPAFRDLANIYIIPKNLKAKSPYDILAEVM